MNTKRSFVKLQKSAMIGVTLLATIHSILVSTAQADPAGTYVGIRSTNSEHCFLKFGLPNARATGNRRSAELKNWRFSTRPSASSGCRTFVSNISAGAVQYPDYITKLRIHLSQDCQTVESFEFQNGMNEAQIEAYTCINLRKVSEN